MKVRLNGFELNDATEQVYLDEDVTGLGLADVRTSSGTTSGRHGGYVGAQLFDIRQVHFEGRIFSEPSVLEEKRAELQAALVSGFSSTDQRFPVEVEIETNQGNEYLIHAFFSDLRMPIQRSLSRAPFNIELIAPDPVIYDSSTAGLTSATLSRQTGGGLTWPLTWPLTWAGGSGPTTVSNGGTVTVYPTITLTGIMSNPIITNLTTGQVFKLNPFVTATGDVVVIDMRQRTVLLNGGNIAPSVTTDSSWLGLVPGSNTLLLTTSSGSDTVTGTVEWKPGVMGI